MVRHLVVPVLVAVLLVPDWATAFDPCVYPPPVYLPPCPPVVYRPVVYGPVVYGPAAPCTPTTGTVVPEQKGPTVVPERMEQQKEQPKTEQPKVAPVKAEEPVAKPVEPTPVKPVEPTPVKPTEPAPVKPVAVQPKPDEKIVVPPTDRIPMPAVPLTPPPSKPEQGLPDFDIPPIGDVPLAKPEPAEDPTPAVKPAETPKPPSKLPEFSFDLPKVEGDMAQPVEAHKKRVSNSSPLTGAAVVDVYPRDGKNVLTAKRGVTFVNKSPRDVLLTVDGKTVTLPSKTVMSAEVPAAFNWQIGGEPERNVKVPDGSPGVDVVIRQ